MTTEERDAVDLALLALQQIECLAIAVRRLVESNPIVEDAIGGIERFAELSRDALDHIST